VQKRKPAKTGWDATYGFINNIKNTEIYDALKTMETKTPIGQGQSGIVYNLGQKISGHQAVVKVIYWPKAPGTEEEVIQEATNLYQVGQLFGVGHTHDRNHYYLVMPYLGVPWEQTNLNEEQATHLMNEAFERYQTECHITHE